LSLFNFEQRFETKFYFVFPKTLEMTSSHLERNLKKISNCFNYFLNLDSHWTYLKNICLTCTFIYDLVHFVVSVLLLLVFGTILLFSGSINFVQQSLISIYLVINIFNFIIQYFFTRSTSRVSFFKMSVGACPGSEPWKIVNQRKM